MRDADRMLTLRAYVADIGRVSFLSVFSVIIAGLLLERASPGVAANVLSPQWLVAAAVAAGALALLGPSEGSRKGWRTAAWTATALFLTVIVFSASFEYVGSLPVAFIAAGCAALPFLAYGRTPHNG